jgi:hypothetical protein
MSDKIVTGYDPRTSSMSIETVTATPAFDLFGTIDGSLFGELNIYCAFGECNMTGFELGDRFTDEEVKEFFSRPHIIEFEINFIRPDILSTHNINMIKADVYGDAESRFRNCVNCQAAFKFVGEDNWICLECQEANDELNRRALVNKALMDANRAIK